MNVSSVAKLIDFYQRDHDHVLRRRFHRLHLYNIYHKHNRLVELDRDLICLERAIKQNKKTDEPQPIAQLQAEDLKRQIDVIDSALKDFGMFTSRRCFGRS
jgi:hypothetical protein